MKWVRMLLGALFDAERHETRSDGDPVYRQAGVGASNFLNHLYPAA